MLTEHTPVAIQYTNAQQTEVTYRTIIPTSIPKVQDNVKAIDVTDMSQSDIDAVIANLDGYASYAKQYRSMMLSLEDWVEHTTNHRPSYKWRTFKQDNIVEQ